MEKVLNFVDYTDKNLEEIGACHQVIGLSKKNHKYAIGNTSINPYSGKVTCSLWQPDYSHIAKLD